MRHPHRLVALGLIGLVVAGCSSPTASAPASADPTPTAAPTASPPATTDSPEPIPSEALEEFICDELPIHEDATVARANLVDVRMATHVGYDRVVFEFVDGLPEVSLDRVEPPFSHDPSGLPIDVEGTSFLRLIMRGGTKQTLEGTSSYDGPTEFDPGFPTLVDLVEGGDFEAQSTWYFGLSTEACVRVMALTDDGAPRLVIDVEAVPSADLGPFVCGDPVVEGTDPARAQIVDVRIGAHADYDRVVIEFANALPEVSLERAAPPFSHDVTGEPIDVEGTSFLRLTLAGGTKETDEHTSSYDGPTDFDPGFPVLVDLVEGGDFEAHSTWYLGLNGPACSRVTLLTDDGPPRLVIDVQS